MDIRKWGLDRIMQLPDGCFGRRWPIIFSGVMMGGITGYYISELALPERCVIWQLFAFSHTTGGTTVLPIQVDFSYKLGDQHPNATSFPTMECLFPGIDWTNVGARSFYPFAGCLSLRQPVMSSGRRICLRVTNSGPTVLPWTTGVVVSSVPNEVPDCLLSV